MIIMAYLMALFSITAPATIGTMQSPAGNQQKNQPGNQQKPKPQTPPKTEPLWKIVLKFAGISSTPSAMKGGESELAGDLCIFDLVTRSERRITRHGRYRSPIFLPGDGKLLALRGEDIVEIPFDGDEGKTLFTIKGVEKLVGVSKDGGKQVLLLKKDEPGQAPIGLLSLSNQAIAPVAFNENSDDDNRLLEHLRGWERVFSNHNMILYIKTETKDGLAGSKIEWSDVYLKKDKQEPINISNCDGANCGQPSLSFNARYVVYIKSDG